MIRAARLTVGPKKSPARCSAWPAWTPIRTRSGPVSPPRLAGQVALGPEPCGHGVGRAAEGGHHAIAGGLHDPSARGLDGSQEDRVVTPQGVGHRTRESLP